MFILHEDTLINTSFVTYIKKQDKAQILLVMEDRNFVITYSNEDARNSDWKYLIDCIDNEWELCDLNEEDEDV